MNADTKTPLFRLALSLSIIWIAFWGFWITSQYMEAVEARKQAQIQARIDEGQRWRDTQESIRHFECDTWILDQESGIYLPPSEEGQAACNARIAREFSDKSKPYEPKQTFGARYRTEREFVYKFFRWGIAPAGVLLLSIAFWVQISMTLAIALDIGRHASQSYVRWIKSGSIKPNSGMGDDLNSPDERTNR